MSIENKEKNPEFIKEREHALEIQKIISDSINIEKSLLSVRRSDILDERKYFIDYFYELPDDERRDLLENEFIDMKTYESTLVRFKNLTKQLREPYFARIDFTEDDFESESLYIGTNMVRDPKTNLIVVYDWRAPISNMYYECEPGRASYIAPSGKIEGDLTLKRKYVFQKGALEKYININMPSDDEFLAEILSHNASSHLKSIVETLQTEQNRIIRDYLDGISVIQGCAGSGKSSIALHKIAYIMYTFRNKIKDKEIVILSPNTLFSDYISTLLPDLGEENVIQTVQEDIINDILSDVQVDYFNRNQSIEYEMASPDDTVREVSKFKAGTEFLQIIKAYAEYLPKMIFKPEVLYLDAECYSSVSAEELGELFFEKFDKVCLFDRPEKIANYLIESRRLRTENIKEFLVENMFEMFRFTTLETIYKNIFFDKEFYSYLEEKGGFESVVAGREDLSHLSVVPTLWSDAVSMALLGMMLSDYGREKNVFYFIADEAQDLTPVFIEILKIRYGSSNMLFAGDNAQLVFSNTGDYVNELKAAAGYKPFRVYNLTSNYRSTTEIAEFAKAKCGMGNIEIRCVRSGEKPEIIPCGNDAAGSVNDYIKECTSKGYESIAVLCLTQAEADSLKPVIEYDTEKVNVTVLPVYMAKGLEFDCVAVMNCNSRMAEYDSKNGSCVLYTACTRAMHNLAVFE
ncbi:MAG: AAA family ATPase [Clostridia bacterium]|nr:AAA family ATPase [Clostridia bacterium]